MAGPPSIWQQIGHGRWQRQEEQTVATGGVGNSAAGGEPCTEGRPAPVVTTDGIGNSAVGGEPCTGDGAGLHFVLGARELGFDDPEGDPFAQLEEEEELS